MVTIDKNEEYLIDNVIVLHKEHIVDQSNGAIGLYGMLLMLIALINLTYGDSLVGLYGDEKYITTMLLLICIVAFLFTIVDRYCTKPTTRFRYTVAVLDGADTEYIENNYYVGEKRGKMWVVSDKKSK